MLLGEYILKLTSDRSVYPSDFIERDRWLDKQLESIDIGLDDEENYLLSAENMRHNASTRSVNGNVLPYHKCDLWNVWIRIDERDNILDMNIALCDGALTFVELSMSTNLLLAKCVGKEIVYDTHFVEIPVMLFELMYRKRFPLHIAQNVYLNVVLTDSDRKKYPIQSIRYDYDEINTTNMNRGVCTTIQSYILPDSIEGYDRVGDKSFVKLSGPYKIIFFEFDDDKSLESMVFTFLGCKLEYSVANGEIVKCKIIDRKIYMLSCTPDIVKVGDLEKLFSQPREKKKYASSFTACEKVRITFQFCDGEKSDRCKLMTVIFNNVLFFGENMFAYRYKLGKS